MDYATVLTNAGSRADHVAERLLALRAALRAEVPPKLVDAQLLLATWNIREFGGRNKGGVRRPESLAYIAEILSHFDLIALQEVRNDVTDLERVVALLGPWWKVLYTDVTAGTSGNGERMAYLYDSRVVTFGGLAGELVLPPSKGVPALQFARTPYTCQFVAGPLRLELSTVHIYYGTSKRDDPRRLAEIQALARFLAKRANARPGGAQSVVLGDFNIFGRADATYAALTSTGFRVPEPLLTVPGSNVPKNKHYDQIAFLGGHAGLEAASAGVFDFYRHVFRDGRDATGSDVGRYGKSKKEFGTWRSFQMSDHLPMWVALRYDAARCVAERSD